MKCGRKRRVRFDDPWVTRAVRVLAAERAGPRPQRRPASPDLAVRDALSLAREEQPRRRWLVESLLLTNEPLEKIASRCSASVDMVEAYHQLFFDVRPHIAARDWIMARAV